MAAKDGGFISNLWYAATGKNPSPTGMDTLFADPLWADRMSGLPVESVTGSAEDAVDAPARPRERWWQALARGRPPGATAHRRLG